MNIKQSLSLNLSPVPQDDSVTANHTCGQVMKDKEADLSKIFLIIALSSPAAKTATRAFRSLAGGIGGAPQTGAVRTECGCAA